MYSFYLSVLYFLCMHCELCIYISRRLGEEQHQHLVRVFSERLNYCGVKMGNSALNVKEIRFLFYTHAKTDQHGV